MSLANDGVAGAAGVGGGVGLCLGEVWEDAVVNRGELLAGWGRAREREREWEDAVRKTGVDAGAALAGIWLIVVEKKTSFVNDDPPEPPPKPPTLRQCVSERFHTHGHV